VTAVDLRTPGRGGIPGLLDSLEKPLWIAGFGRFAGLGTHDAATLALAGAM